MSLRRHLNRLLQRFRRDDDGVVAFDFVIVFPLYLMLFLAAFETAMLMTRQVLLDRGLDMAIRIVRLNTINPPTYEQFKDMVCDASALIADCDNALRIEMEMQDPRGTLDFPTRPTCVNRSLSIQPAAPYSTGSQNQMMFVRACVKYEPFFPTATFGAAVRDIHGEYVLVSTSIYVTEPNG